MSRCQGSVTAPGGSRRARFGIALVAAMALVLTGCQGWFGDDGGSGDEAPPADPTDVASPEGDGSARCDGVAIAYAGTINGHNAELGRNVHNGAELAVRRHNTANEKCQVEFVELETEGLAGKAKGIVSGLVEREEVIGLVGLPFTDESNAVGGILDSGGLVQISPSATSAALADKGWKTFYRGTANDVTQGKAAAEFLTENLDKQKVCVVRDDSAYGRGLAGSVKAALGDHLACDEKIRAGQSKFSSVVKRLAAEKPDAVYFAGYYSDAGPLAKALHAGGVDAQFVGSDAAKDAEFITEAGRKAASGVYFTCPCAPDDEFGGFVARYTKAFGRAPGSYAVEGYDAATVLLSGIDAGNHDRQSLRSYVDKYEGKGLSNPFEWNGKGELTETAVWAYQVRGNEIVQHAKIK